jgi:hypothetical protein
MNCNGGVCVPTATNAVLNTADLESMLATGSLSILTTNGAIQAGNIDITAQVSWKTTTSLTLDAFQSIAVTSGVNDGGNGGVTLIINDGGSGGALSFQSGGSLSIANIKDVLTINGKRYKLEDNIAGLAFDILAHPGSDFALAASYNAKPDGIYRTDPISGTFSGAFTGLGHVISNLEIDDSTDTYVGLFSQEAAHGTISDIGLKDEIVDAINAQDVDVGVGGLVGHAAGGINNSWVSGTVTATFAGGLVGYNEGTISGSWSSAEVHGNQGGGGLVGESHDGIITGSFATGNVDSKIILSPNSTLGGLVGVYGGNTGTIQDSYALGNVTANDHHCACSTVGGLAGSNKGTVSTSYAAGRVSASAGSAIGGFLGVQNGTASSDYWDKTRNKKATNGVGSGHGTGVEALTTRKLQSGLPTGFDSTIWAESPSINNGLPYLIANPPQ